MKHERVTEVSSPSESGPTPPLTVWNVYSADRHLVATYPVEAAAAAHVASWPALYYSAGPAAPPAPVSGSFVPS